MTMAVIYGRGHARRWIRQQLVFFFLQKHIHDPQPLVESYHRCYQLNLIVIDWSIPYNPNAEFTFYSIYVPGSCSVSHEMEET